MYTVVGIVHKVGDFNGQPYDNFNLHCVRDATPNTDESGQMTEVIKVKVTTTDDNSTISKVLKLVEEASAKKSHTEEFISKFAKVYTPIVIILALLVFLIPTIFIDASNAYNYLHRACMFLVISCPCALVFLF